MKQKLKSSLVDLATNRYVIKLAGLFQTQFVPIFMLHRIENKNLGVYGHDLEMVERALSYLQRAGYNFVSVESLISDLREGRALAPNSISFTLDDGYWDQAEIAAPLFAKYECPATFFISTGFVGGDVWLWDSKVQYLLEHATSEDLAALSEVIPGFFWTGSVQASLELINKWLKTKSEIQIHSALADLSHRLNIEIPKHAPDKYRAMSLADVRKLISLGMKVGPHSVSHPILSNESSEGSSEQISNSWKHVQAMTGNVASPVFCYPVGRESDFQKREEQFVEASGMLGGVSAIPGYVDKHARNNIYALPRFSFPNNLTDLKQYSTWVERAKIKYRSKKL